MHQGLTAIQRIAHSPIGAGIGASFMVVVAAGIIAPGDGPGGWVWLCVMSIWLLAALAIGAIAAVGTRRHANAGRWLLLVWGGLLLAVLLNLAFDARTTALATLSLVLLLLAAPGSGSALLFWSIAGAMLPMWVWSAFDAWDPWVLMLVPIAAVGVVSREHALRATHDASRVTESIAAWIGPLAIAAATLLIVLLTGVAPAWVTLVAGVTATLAALDLAMTRLSTPPPLAGILPTCALALLGFGWLAAR